MGRPPVLLETSSPSTVTMIGAAGVLIVAALQPWGGDALEPENLLDAFSIRRGEIIQPTTSQANGARYLNDTQLETNEQCLLWCWKSSRCNVAIFGSMGGSSSGSSSSASIRRTCYLFDCGPAARNCSFVPNENYVTSTIAGRRPTPRPHAPADHLPLRSNSLQDQLAEDDRDCDQDSTLTPPNMRAGSRRRCTSRRPPACRSGHFRCADGSGCISARRVCDGLDDCRDASDETTCPFRVGQRASDWMRPRVVGRRLGLEHASEGAQHHQAPSMSISLKQVESDAVLDASGDVALNHLHHQQQQQSGAILAMALGLCVTALLLVVVGCKLRLIRRRLVHWRRETRKGLSLLADDDDEDDDEEEEDDVVHGII